MIKYYVGEYTLDIKKLFKNKIPLALAPMAGVTDASFRSVCRSCGADLTYSEMVSSRALVHRDSKTHSLLTRDENDRPFAVQLFGCEPGVMAEAARIALEITNAEFIDINMGCPTPKIVSNGDGSALMRKPALAAEIVRAVKSAVSVPVTVKFRKGWDGGSVNAVEFAKTLEEAGADALTVHGRTRVAMYSGRADRDIIREVKKSVSVPVIANGDVFEPEDAKRIIDYTGADGVMIGRASFGNPWIFTGARASLDGAAIPPIPPLRERLETAFSQIEASAAQKGERCAVLESRRHIAWYLRGVRGGNFYKTRVTNVSSLSELRTLVDEMKRNLI